MDPADDAAPVAEPAMEVSLDTVDHVETMPDEATEPMEAADAPAIVEDEPVIASIEVPAPLETETMSGPGLEAEAAVAVETPAADVVASEAVTSEVDDDIAAQTAAAVKAALAQLPDVETAAVTPAAANNVFAAYAEQDDEMMIFAS